jgi:hypothetical protein
LPARQGADGVGEVQLAALGGGEALLRARRDVVDDPQHRPSLIRRAGARIVLHDGDALARQVAGADVVRRVDLQRPAVEVLGRGVERVRQGATVIPRPSMPRGTRSTRSAWTPCDVARPTFVNGFSACDTDATPGVAASA